MTGDVGGTNSRMSLYDCKSTEPKVVNHYRNAVHLPEDRLLDPNAFPKNIIEPFLELCFNDAAKNGLESIENSEIVACIATAGVVSDNRANLTNLGGLLIDGNAIQSYKTNKYLKHIRRCVIINDFVAQGTFKLVARFTCYGRTLSRVV